MNNIENSAAGITEVQSAPAGKTRKPGSIPVKVYLQEAENICNWCRQDREILTANGLDWTIIEDMPNRIDALREAQARWTTSDSRDTETEREWIEKSDSAREFRAGLVRSLKFVFRRNHPAISKIKRIAEGSSHAAMIQSLRDFSVFGQEHAEFLKNTKFDITLLDTAGVMSRELATLLGAVNTARAFSSDLLKVRDQAFTQLDEALKELKDHADYVFRHDPSRLSGYSSDYYRKNYLKSKKKKASDEKTV